MMVHTKHTQSSPGGPRSRIEQDRGALKLSSTPPLSPSSSPTTLQSTPPAQSEYFSLLSFFSPFLQPLPPHGVGCSTEHTCSTSTHLQSGSSYLQLQTFLFNVAKNTKHNLLNSRISLTLNSRIYPDSSV